MQITVKNRQWLGDMALEGAGSIEALFSMAQSNGLSITDNLDVGAVLQFNEMLDKETVNYYQVNEISPATALESSEAGEGGIGYMQIQTDFKIS